MRAATVAKIILVAVGVLAGLYFLYLIRAVIGALVIATFVAVALGPAVDFLHRHRFPRSLSILTCYLGILLAVFGIGLLIVPPVVGEIDDFVRDVPTYVSDLRQSDTIRTYDNRYGITGSLRKQAEGLPDRLGGAVAALQSVTVGIFSAVFQVVTILILAFFLLMSGGRIVEFMLRELGPVRGPRWRAILENVYRAVGGYVLGVGLIAAIAGLSTFVVLTIIGVDFAVPLAVLMAFLVLIPLIGATVASVIIAVFVAIEAFPVGLIAWVAFAVVYQQFENAVLQPQIMRRTVSLAPLAVIVAVLIGASLLGVLGALLAIPIAAAIQIVVKDYWATRHDHLLPEAEASSAIVPPAASPPTAQA